MVKEAQLPQMITVKERSSDTVKIVKLIALGVFFTTVVTVCVFFAARYGSAAPAMVQPCPVLQDHKLLNRDVKRVRDVKNNDGRILHGRFTYDHESNTVMVETQGNFSGESPATLVIDYDRALVFAYVLDADKCMVFSLYDDLRQLVRMELSTADGDFVVADTVQANDNYTMYSVAGQLPESFVQSFSGPTVDGMCAGRNTYWLEQVDKTENNYNWRGKRGCFYLNVAGLFILHICD